MTDVPQSKLYQSPQERWFSIASTPDVFPDDDPRELFFISSFSNFQLPGSRSGDLDLVKQQNALRKTRVFDLLMLYDHPQARTELGLRDEEKLGMTFKPLIEEGPNMGMTSDNPGFVAVTLDRETNQPVNTRDITEIFYRRYEERDPPSLLIEKKEEVFQILKEI